MKTSPRIIVALDYHREDDALALVDQLDPALCRLKIGKELFTAVGPGILGRLHEKGFEVFLDLKFHDIPNTVAGAVSAAADHGVWMVNVHALGGRRMMEAAAGVLEHKREGKPLLIAVTLLTSMDESDLRDIGLQPPLHERVSQLAELARETGMDGVVCSAREARALKSGKAGFVAVTPGIRLAGDSQGDQRRVMTPSAAVEEGADYLVIGRSITASADPLKALQQVCQEIQASES